MIIEPEGQYIGLSVSRCIKDIVDGNMPLHKVIGIIGGTKFDEDTIDEVSDIYCSSQWRHNVEWGKSLLEYLYYNDKIIQPRNTNQNPPAYSEQIWILIP